MDPQLQRYGMIAIFGIIAGWLAGMIVGHARGGFIGSMIAGLLGAVVGSFLFDMFKINLPLGNPIAVSLVQAVVGAIIVLRVARVLL